MIPILWLMKLRPREQNVWVTCRITCSLVSRMGFKGERRWGGEEGRLKSPRTDSPERGPLEFSFQAESTCAMHSLSSGWEHPPSPCQLCSLLSPSCGLCGHSSLWVMCSCASPAVVTWSRSFGSSLNEGITETQLRRDHRGPWVKAGRRWLGTSVLWWTRRLTICPPCPERHPKSWLQEGRRSFYLAFRIMGTSQGFRISPWPFQ